MTAKEYLSQYRECVKTLKTKHDELLTLIEDATAISSPTEGGTHTPGAVSDKVGRKSAEIADLEAEIEAEREVLRVIRRDIRSSISHVHSADLRRLLTYRYICGCTWERVAVKMNYSYVHIVHRMHPKALAEIGNTMQEMHKNVIECNSKTVI